MLWEEVRLTLSIERALLILRGLSRVEMSLVRDRFPGGGLSSDIVANRLLSPSRESCRCWWDGGDASCSLVSVVRIGYLVVSGGMRRATLHEFIVCRRLFVCVVAGYDSTF